MLDKELLHCKIAGTTRLRTYKIPIDRLQVIETISDFETGCGETRFPMLKIEKMIFMGTNDGLVVIDPVL